MAFHRDSHYVPCSYLKRWTDADKVWTYRVLVPHPKFRKPVTGLLATFGTSVVPPQAGVRRVRGRWP